MKTGSNVAVGRCDAINETVFADLDDNAWFVYKEITHEGRVRMKLDADSYLRIEDGKAKFFDVGADGALQEDEAVVAVDVSIDWAAAE